MPGVPIRVYYKGSTEFIETLTFFDSGSSCTYMKESLASKLGYDGPRTSINVETFSYKVTLKPKVIDSVVLGNISGKSLVVSEKVLTSNEIPCTAGNMHTREDCKNYPHSQEVVKQNEGFTNLEFGFLIGNDFLEAVCMIRVSSRSLIARVVVCRVLACAALPRGLKLACANLLRELGWQLVSELAP